MRKYSAALALAGAALSVPARAEASVDGYFWESLCSSGAVVACASVMVRTTWIGPHSNLVQLMVRNLEGADSRDNTGGSVFDAFSLGLPSAVPFPSELQVPGAGIAGSVGLVGNSLDPTRPGWGPIDGTVEFGGLFFHLIDRPAYGMAGDGIRGCNPGPQRGALPTGETLTTINTCASQGYTGWAWVSTVAPEFTTPYAWDITGAGGRLFGVAHDGRSFTLDFDAATAVVLPEPKSVLLLGAGLVIVLLGLRARGALRYEE